jgi:hypothetical protein
MDKKVNIPKKGAGRRLAARLKELGKQKPPQSLIDKIIKQAEEKMSAMPAAPKKDMDLE